jgi:hypothetical protein
LVDCFSTATAAYSKGAPFYNACEIAGSGDFQGLWEEGRRDGFIVLSPTLSIRPAFPPLPSLPLSYTTWLKLAGADVQFVPGSHGELFYLAIRRWIYSMPVQDDLDGIIENAIVRFLRGAPAAVRVAARSSAR